MNCDRCDEPILPGDPAPIFDTLKPFHRECAMRMIIGGANHLLNQCSCHEGLLSPDPEGLSKRAAARVAVAVFEALEASR